MSSDIGFSSVWTNLFMIDITPTGDERTWARLGAGLTGVEPEGNEEIVQEAYLDGEGQASSDVTGGQKVLSFEGNRKVGDPAQDYIASLEFEYGEARRTKLRHIDASGMTTEVAVTIVNIVTGGGDANDPNSFSFELHFDGIPYFTAGDATTFPTAITCDAVTVAVGSRVTVAPAVTPETATASFVYAIEDDSIATVNADGTVVGVAAGETKLNIKSAVKPTVMLTVDVTVSASS